MYNELSEARYPVKAWFEIGKIAPEMQDLDP